jgi:hypothetical protein
MSTLVAHKTTNAKPKLYHRKPEGTAGSRTHRF